MVPARFTLDASHQQFSQRHGVNLVLHPIRPELNLTTQLRQSRADLCLLSGDQAPTWRHRKVLAHWDTSQLPQLATLHEPLLRTAFDHWRFSAEGLHWVPCLWGAEGISWRTDLTDDTIPHSYSALWEDADVNSTFIRPTSALHAVAYLLESQGDLPPGTVLRADISANASQRAHEAAYRYMRLHKNRVKLTWNDANTQIQGLLEDGAALGQGWDTPALALRSVAEPVNFCAPDEGALTWTLGWSRVAASTQSEMAHAFLATCLDPVHAGAAIANHGFHTAVRGAEEHASDAYRLHFQDVFHGAAIARLRPAPQQSQWHREINSHFAHRFLRA